VLVAIAPRAAAALKKRLALLQKMPARRLHARGQGGLLSEGGGGGSRSIEGREGFAVEEGGQAGVGVGEEGVNGVGEG
jgi:hypothetical protein